MGRLAQSEIDAYKDQGYLLLRQAIEPKEVAAARTLVTKLVDDRARKLKDEGKISSLFEEESFERRLARMSEEAEVMSGLWDLAQQFDDPELFRLLRYPGILDVLESLIGSEIGWTSSYVTRPKLNHDSEPRPEGRSRLGEFPWHQDSQYYGGPTRHLHIVSIWIPLVDVDEQNGCLYVLPQSHNWGLLDGERGDDNVFRTYQDVQKRGTQPVALPMRPGDMLLFTNLTYHCSRFNTTNTVRWSVDMRFVAPPGARSLSSEEQAGYDTLDEHYRTPPVTVRSRQPENVAGVAQLRQFIERKNKRIAAG